MCEIKVDEIKSKMLNYTCHKTVKATPMSKVEYHELRNWTLPEEDESGYLIMYEPDGHPNVIGFEGYVSWSPKNAFEKGYKLSETFIDRLKIELNDLEEKIKNLEGFLFNGKSDSLDKMQWELLVIQLSAMKTYYNTVKTRFESLT